MLSDRVQTNENGFRVLRGEESDRRLFYKEINLRDDPDDYGGMIEVAYWSSAMPTDIPMEGKKFILIAEKTGDRVVDTHRFYFSQKKAFCSMTITMKPAKGYGKGAQMITIQWDTYEKIRNQYIWLENRETKERYPFLAECITPLTESQSEDKYVYYPEEGYSADSYQVMVDPLLRQKYRVTVR